MGKKLIISHNNPHISWIHTFTRQGETLGFITERHIIKMQLHFLLKYDPFLKQKSENYIQNKITLS